MYECVGRCKTAFGIAKSSGFKRCIVCKMVSFSPLHNRNCRSLDHGR